MKTIKLLLFCILILQQTYGQEFNYERVWATYYGGENTFALDNAKDSQGNIYIVGMMEGEADYLNPFITANSFQSIFGGGTTDGFIAKFSPSGLLIWSTFFGGTGADRINTVEIDSADRLFVAGSTSSTMMATPGAYREFLTGLNDAFLAEFDTNGQRIWSTYYGGVYNDEFSGIASDESDALYLFGKTSSPENIATPLSFNEAFIPNPTITNPENDYKDFMVGFTKSGNRLWGTYYGTNTQFNRSDINGITLNASGLYIVGQVFDTNQNNYFATDGCHQSYNSNAVGIGSDMFLSKFAFDGTRQWSTYFGGSGSDKSIAYGAQLYVRNLRNVKASPDFVYISGTTNSNNNVATAGVFQPVKQYHSNFVAKFNNQGVQQWGSYLGNTGPAGVSDGAQYTMLNFDAEGEILVSGCTVFSDVATAGSYQPVIELNDFGNVESPDSFVARISKDGSTRYFGTYYGGRKAEHAANTLTDNDSFYIIGSTKSATAIATPNGFQPELNLNLEPWQQLNAFIAKFSPIPLASETFDNQTAVVYPNPNKGAFTIHLNDNYLGADVSIVDASGKVVYRETIQRASQHINAQGLSKGFYVISIKSKYGTVYNEKILVN